MPFRSAEAQARFKARNPTYRRDWHLRHTYGITQEDFNRMAAAQDYVCAVCKRDPEKGHLHVDHDHVTGKVRGLLCGACNRTLGLTSESPERLRALAEYLERSI